MQSSIGAPMLAALLLVSGCAFAADPADGRSETSPAPSGSEQSEGSTADGGVVETGTSGDPTTTVTTTFTDTDDTVGSADDSTSTGPGNDTQGEPGGVRIIWDTDMASDWDDVGALAILHALADEDGAQILGLGSSSRGTAGEWNPHTMDIIGTYYGRPDIPIGRSLSGPNVTDTYGQWAIEQGFPYELGPDQVWDDVVSLYRKLLSEQPDHSVILVTTGYMSNISDLLNSGPDEYSDLDGIDLVALKVDYWSAMAGRYPSSGSEANLQDWDGQAKHAFDNFPRPVVGTSAETGNMSIAGNSLESTPTSNPVRAIYRKRLDDNGYPDAWSHNTWDLVATLVAVRDPSEYFELTVSGTNVITIQGDNSQHNEWQDTPDHGFRYLIPEEITPVLEDLISRPPTR